MVNARIEKTNPVNVIIPAAIADNVESAALALNTNGGSTGICSTIRGKKNDKAIAPAMIPVGTSTMFEPIHLSGDISAAVHTLILLRYNTDNITAVHVFCNK
jgi:hypothetical protein